VSRGERLRGHRLLGKIHRRLIETPQLIAIKKRTTAAWDQEKKDRKKKNTAKEKKSRLVIERGDKSREELR